MSVGADLPKTCSHDLDKHVLPIFDSVKIILVLLIQMPQGIWSTLLEIQHLCCSHFESHLPLLGSAQKKENITRGVRRQEAGQPFENQYFHKQTK